ncbi:MAG: hypothetical protein VB934_20510 [Polyangiaceae bacterium]
MPTFFKTPLPGRLTAAALSFNLFVFCSACGGDAIQAPTVTDGGGDGGGSASASSSSSSGAGGEATSTTSSSSNATTTAGAGGSRMADPFGPDPKAVITLDSGEVSGCIPDLLKGGSAAAYSGYAGASDGAYFVWRQKWAESDLDFRIETWDAFGGITEPGTYALTKDDTNYVDCAVCVFASSPFLGEFWPTPGDTVTFTSLSTGDGGVGQTLAGTYEGSLSNGECTVKVTISFDATAREMSYGPF